MGKFALLIGVSDSSEEDLPALPSAIEDIRAMQAVMQDPKLGDFDSVTVLPNPTRQKMEEAIETLFANRKQEDLVLFYFSGHGITDEKGKLYLVIPQTRKERGKLMKTTAVAATVLHDNMGNSRSKHQVLILDSCYSGAIAEGLTGKSAGSKVDIQRELGGAGRAILTSSNAVQKSFHIQHYKLSIYTHYLIDGIQTGAANQGGDDYISVEELHEYAKKKLEQEVPLMSPQFFPVKEGYKIKLVQSPKQKGDPELEYRKEAERLLTIGGFTIPAKRILMSLRLELGILNDEAEVIEAEVLKPHREYQGKRQEYEETLRQCLEQESPLSQRVINDLGEYRIYLRLNLEDVVDIHRTVLNVGDLEDYAEFLEKQTQQGKQQQETQRQQRYEQAFRYELAREYPLHPFARERLKRLQESLELSDEVTVQIEQRLAAPQEAEYRQEVEAKRQREYAAYKQNQLLNAIEQPRSDQDALSSERFGTKYYTKLRDLLAAQDWKAAEQETSERMCEVMDVLTYCLNDGQIERFPCLDLNNIDGLWVKYSQGKFGFSVQKRIWEIYGSPVTYDDDWEKFSVTVGWRRRNLLGIGARWISYSKLFGSKSAEVVLPHGCLPVKVCGLYSAEDLGRSKSYVRLNHIIVFSRLQICKS